MADHPEILEALKADTGKTNYVGGSKYHDRATLTLMVQHYTRGYNTLWRITRIGLRVIRVRPRVQAGKGAVASTKYMAISPLPLACTLPRGVKVNAGRVRSPPFGSTRWVDATPSSTTSFTCA